MINSKNIFAWGENEQNALKGFIGGIVLKHLYDNHNEHKYQHNNSHYHNYQDNTKSLTDIKSSKKIPFECKK